MMTDQDAKLHADGHPGKAPEAREVWRLRALLASILLVALCSIIYELIIATLSSYLLGNSVFQFSLVIGLYLSGMGVGSYLSRFVRGKLLETFIWVELAIGVIGGTSAALLFGIFAYTDFFQLAIWFFTLLVGTLVGLEIPLLTRYVNGYTSLRQALSQVLSWDYIGSLIGSIAFPLLLLPSVGLLNSAAIVGLLNVTVAVAGLWIFRRDLDRFRALAFSALAATVLLVGVFGTSGAYERFLDKKLFVDAVVHKEQTPYQKITMTAWKDDYRLFINGTIQFSTEDEYRYHELLVHPAMVAVARRSEVLVLGGGDGLALREILKYPEVKRVVLVDLDPAMTRLGLEHPILQRVNESAFRDPRVEVVHRDAMQYLIDTSPLFDVVISDLPDPNHEALAKLYSVEFFRLVGKRLAAGGVVVTQSSSVYYSPNTFWCIHQSMEAAFCPSAGCTDANPHVLPYHVWVPSFGDWGFNLASKRPLAFDDEESYPVPTRFLNADVFRAARHFPPDVAERKLDINRLIEPNVLSYYLRDWRRFNH
jgi:spermidine synthase